MSSILVATDFVAALFIVVIIIGLYEIPAEAIRATRHFRRCMWVVLVGLGVECLALSLNGRENMTVAVLLLYYAGYVLLDVLTIVYSHYLIYLVEESARRFTQIQARAVTVALSLDICILTAGVITGKFFTVTNGLYTLGPWADYMGKACILCFFVMCILYVFKYRAFRIKSRLFVVLIVAVPMGATIINIIYKVEGFGFLGAAVSMNVVYVILESKIIAEAVANAKKYNEISENDQLTGLKNRRGYQKVLDGISDGDCVGVVFADVNSLKELNDSEGHEAGDKLIKRVADIIKNAVPGGITCRISGDEFVCIVKNVDPDAFADRMKNLEAIMRENDRIAAIGYDAGDGKNIYGLIKSAEKIMYTDKQNYYKETGKDRRR